jgi:hypothetical protein
LQTKKKDNIWKQGPGKEKEDSQRKTYTHEDCVDRFSEGEEDVLMRRMDYPEKTQRSKQQQQEDQSAQTDFDYNALEMFRDIV